MKNKVLAATINPVTKNNMFTVIIDIPYCLLPELLQHKKLDITYRKIEDITLQEVLDNPFVPIWTEKGKLLERSNFLNSTQLWNNILEHFENNDIRETYEELVKEGVDKQISNNLLIPFAYTTCIISGTEWSSFFELRCPQYLCLDGDSYKSKKEWWFFARLYHGFGSENIQEPDWQSINKSSVQPEFQIISEMLYDLYQEADWKESEYHIPFEEYINEKYLNKIQEAYLTNFAFSGTSPKQFELDCKFKISNSLCKNFSAEGTLEYHLNNKNI